MTDQLPVFTIERTFNAPRDLVWKAWTDPKMIAQWFGPKDAKCAILKQELKVGGVQHARIEMPGAPVMYGKFTYQEIVPKEKLVWLHSFSDEGGVNLTRHPFAPEWPLELLTVLTFKDNGTRTDIKLTWTPVSAKPNEVEVFRKELPGMQQGWGGTFENLDHYIAKSDVA